MHSIANAVLALIAASEPFAPSDAEMEAHGATRSGVVRAHFTIHASSCVTRIFDGGTDGGNASGHATLRHAADMIPLTEAGEALHRLILAQAPALLTNGLVVEHMVWHGGRRSFSFSAVATRSNTFGTAASMAQRLEEAVAWIAGIPHGGRRFRLSSSMRDDDTTLFAHGPEEAIVLWWANRLICERLDPLEDPKTIHELLDVADLLAKPGPCQARTAMAQGILSEQS